MSYKYETHLHTCQGSVCGRSAGRDYIQKYRDMGFTGIMVTDHFYNSNTRANRSLPWADWVNAYCAGFEEAREEGEKFGLDVFFGWEETFDGDDYLVYGLDKTWLLAHPEVVRWTREDQFREVHKYGGCVIHAHPFRQHYYIPCVHLAPFFVDGIEAYNAGNDDQMYGILALEYARRLGLPVVAGSDIHSAGEYELYGIEVDEKLTSVNDYVRLVLNKADIGLFIPQRYVYHEKDGRKNLDLNVAIYGQNGKPLGSMKRMNFCEIAEMIKGVI